MRWGSNNRKKRSEIGQPAYLGIQIFTAPSQRGTIVVGLSWGVCYVDRRGGI